MRLIDADRLYYKVKCECNPYGKPTIDFESGKKVLDWIENAPTVEPFEKIGAICNENCGYTPKGEWIIMGEEQGALGITYKIKKCDKCGWEHSLVIPNNFCPNCGADMRGGNNE